MRIMHSTGHKIQGAKGYRNRTNASQSAVHDETGKQQAAVQCTGKLSAELKQEGADMEEKTFKTLNGTGALNIALGVIGIVAGVAGGVLLIISGAKLLSRKSKMLF